MTHKGQPRWQGRQVVDVEIHEGFRVDYGIVIIIIVIAFFLVKLRIGRFHFVAKVVQPIKGVLAHVECGGLQPWSIFVFLIAVVSLHQGLDLLRALPRYGSRRVGIVPQEERVHSCSRSGSLFFLFLFFGGRITLVVVTTPTRNDVVKIVKGQFHYGHFIVVVVLLFIVARW